MMLLWALWSVSLAQNREDYELAEDSGYNNNDRHWEAYLHKTQNGQYGGNPYLPYNHWLWQHYFKYNLQMPNAGWWHWMTHFSNSDLAAFYHDWNAPTEAANPKTMPDAGNGKYMDIKRDTVGWKDHMEKKLEYWANIFEKELVGNLYFTVDPDVYGQSYTAAEDVKQAIAKRLANGGTDGSGAHQAGMGGSDGSSSQTNMATLDYPLVNKALIPLQDTNPKKAQKIMDDIDWAEMFMGTAIQDAKAAPKQRERMLEIREGSHKNHTELRSTFTENSKEKAAELETAWSPVEAKSKEDMHTSDLMMESYMTNTMDDAYTVHQDLEQAHKFMLQKIATKRGSIARAWEGVQMTEADQKNDLDDTFVTTKELEAQIANMINNYKFTTLGEKQQVDKQTSKELASDRTKQAEAVIKAIKDFDKMQSADKIVSRRWGKKQKKDFRRMLMDQDRAVAGKDDERKVIEGESLGGMSAVTKQISRLSEGAMKVEDRMKDAGEQGAAEMTEAQIAAEYLENIIDDMYDAEKLEQQKTLDSMHNTMEAKMKTKGNEYDGVEVKEKERFRLENKDVSRQMEQSVHDWKELYAEEAGRFKEDFDDLEGDREAQEKHEAELMERYRDHVEELKFKESFKQDSEKNIKNALDKTLMNVKSETEFEAMPQMQSDKTDAEADLQRYWTEADTAKKYMDHRTEDMLNHLGDMGPDGIGKARKELTSVDGDLSAYLDSVRAKIENVAADITDIADWYVPKVQQNIDAAHLPIGMSAKAARNIFMEKGKDLQNEAKRDSEETVDDFLEEMNSWTGEMKTRASDVVSKVTAREAEIMAELDKIAKTSSTDMESIGQKTEAADDQNLAVSEKFQEEATDINAKVDKVERAAQKVEDEAHAMSSDPPTQMGESMSKHAKIAFDHLVSAFANDIATPLDSASTVLADMKRQDIQFNADEKEKLDQEMGEVFGDLNDFGTLLAKLRSEADAAELGDSALAQQLYQQFDRAKGQIKGLQAQFREEEERQKAKLAAAEKEGEENVLSMADRLSATLDDQKDATQQQVSGYTSDMDDQLAAINAEEDKGIAGANSAASGAAQEVKDDSAEAARQVAALAGDEANAEGTTQDAARDAASQVSEDKANSASVSTMANYATKKLGAGLSNFEKVHHVLETARTAVKALELDLDDRWERGKEAAIVRAKQHLHDANGPHTQQLLNEVAENEESEGDVMKTYKEGLDGLRRQLDTSKDDVTQIRTFIQEGIHHEAEHLQENSRTIEDHAGAQAMTLADTIGTQADNLEHLVNLTADAHRAEQVGWERYAKLAETALSSAGSAEASEAQSLTNSMTALDSQHSQLDQKMHVFRSRDLAFKNMVVEKLASMGVTMSTEGLEMLENARDAHAEALGYHEELGGMLAEGAEGEHSQLDRDLARLYIKQDAAIQKIMDDESLTEEQRKAAIEKIKAGTASEIAELHAKETDRVAAEAKLQAELGRYQAEIEAAAAATDRAIANGHLSPTARVVQQNLAKVGEQVLKLKAKPWLQAVSAASQIQLHAPGTATAHAARGVQLAAKKALEASNAQLRNANQALLQEMAEVEKKIARIKVKGVKYNPKLAHAA